MAFKYIILNNNKIYLKMSKRYDNKYIKNPQNELLDLHRKRGEVYRLIGDYPKAYDSFKRMGIIAGLIKDESLQADAKTKLGSIFIFRGDFEKAKDYFIKLLESFTNNNNIKGQAICNKNLGVVLQNMEEYSVAEKFYNKSIELYKRINDSDGEYDVLKHLAENIYKLKKYSDSISFTENILHYYEKNNNLIEITRCLQLIGNILCNNNEIEKGIEYLIKAYNNSISIGDRIATIYILCDLGVAYYSINKHEKAKDFFIQSLNLAEKYNVSYISCIACLNLGDVYIQLNKINDAKIFLEKAKESKINIPGVKAEVSRLINEIAILERG